MWFLTAAAKKIRTWMRKNVESQPTIVEDPRLAASVRRNAEVIVTLQREKAQREAAYKTWCENASQVNKLLDSKVA